MRDNPKRAAVDDWEKAQPDWRAGTVAGWKMKDGSRSRHAIEVRWLDLERWAPPLGRDLATLARNAAPVAEAENLPASPPKIYRWTACQAITWVALREARELGDDLELPEKDEPDPWGKWPPKFLSHALCEIGNNTPWNSGPDSCSDQQADDVRAFARQLMLTSKKTARELNDALAVHNERHKQVQVSLEQAEAELMQAIRNGHVTVQARPTRKNGSENISAIPEVLDSVMLQEPRCVTMLGRVTYDEANHGFAGLWDYEGPWFDDARFNEAELRARWPAAAEPAPVVTEPDPAALTPSRRWTGGMSYAQQDEPLLDEMGAMLASGAAPNLWQAALAVADKATGKNTTIESRAKRLCDRFRKRSALNATERTE